MFDYIDFDEGRDPVKARAWELRDSVVVLLMGVSGSGKTTAVAEFARWYQETGGIEGPVLFTSFEHRLPLDRVLDQIGQKFGPALERAGVNWLAKKPPKRLTATRNNSGRSTKPRSKTWWPKFMHAIKPVIWIPATFW